MECYFDNSATTPIKLEVLKTMNEAAITLYGNPSSIHRKGLEAERQLKQARECIAESVHASAKEIVFTSCGSESNNLAIKGIAGTVGKRGKHIITSSVEHDAVYKVVRFLEETQGYSVTVLSPDRYGKIAVESVLRAIREDTFLIALMHVNNELGAILDIELLSDEIVVQNKKRSLPIHLHLDAVQSFLKIPLDMRKLSGVSTMSISAHKVHGPKGVGALYRRTNLRLLPLIHGGGQEDGDRSGTENTLGIFGFAEAVRLQKEDIRSRQVFLSGLKDHFVRSVKTQIEDVMIHSPEDGAPHICNLSFLGIGGEVLVHTLEQEGIYISTGSACSSKKKGSRILENIGLPKIERESAVRFSFSEDNTKEQIEHTLSVLCDTVDKLRKILKYRVRKDSRNV